jgi:hypothetical protein
MQHQSAENERTAVHPSSQLGRNVTGLFMMHRNSCHYFRTSDLFPNMRERMHIQRAYI